MLSIIAIKSPFERINDNTTHENQISHPIHHRVPLLERAHPYFEGEAAPCPGKNRNLSVRKKLVIERGSKPNTDICIKSGLPVKSTIVISLRNPFTR